MLYAPFVPRLGMLPDAIQLASVCLIWPSVIFVAGAVLIVTGWLSFPIPTSYWESPTEYVFSDSMSMTALSISRTQVEAAEPAKYEPQNMFCQEDPLLPSGPRPNFPL